MHIIPIVAGDKAAMRRVWEVETAALSYDVPALPSTPVEEIVNEPCVLRHEVRRRWVALDGDRAIGSARLALPQLDNPHVAEISLQVHPQARRRGTGRALFEVALHEARLAGRTCVMTSIPEPVGDDLATGDVSPGAAFAKSCGFEPALAEMCRVLDLDTIDGERLDALATEAAARSGGYDVVQWVGPAPEDLVDHMARLTSRLSTDAPLGDLDWQEEVWDSQRYRDAEAEAAGTGRQWVTTAARHVQTNRVVAYTDIGFSTYQPRFSFQWTTIVEEEHRGHRLGMLIKVANLRLLQRENPVAERIYTWNADSNAHMLAINKAMGFQPAATWCEWQLHLP